MQAYRHRAARHYCAGLFGNRHAVENELRELLRTYIYIYIYIYILYIYIAGKRALEMLESGLHPVPRTPLQALWSLALATELAFKRDSPVIAPDHLCVRGFQVLR